MGCDIHAHFEIKLDGKWEHYSMPDISRRYNLFAKIAGVRNYQDITPICDRKGLPPDATAVTCFEAECDGSDGHSHTWLNKAEYLELMRWVDIDEDDTSRQCRQEFGYLRGNYWHDYEKYPE